MRCSPITLLRPILTSTPRPPLVLTRYKSHLARLEAHHGDRLSAQNDLRWLTKGAKLQSPGTGVAWEKVLERMVTELTEEGKPLAYILGNIPFHPLPEPLIIRPPTLIPRPETESWTNDLSSLLFSHLPFCSQKKLRVLDIGTGSGCIPLALAYSLRSLNTPVKMRFIGVDIAPSALELARENLQIYKDLSPPLPVKFIHADLFSPDFAAATAIALDATANTEEEGFDLIISNPPYIPFSSYTSLDPSVKDWEDSLALTGSPPSNTDGLEYYRRIVSLLPDLLRQKKGARVIEEVPSLVLEVGEGQASQVKEMLEKGAGMGRVEVKEDHWGIERVVYGFRK